MMPEGCRRLVCEVAAGRHFPSSADRASSFISRQQPGQVKPARVAANRRRGAMRISNVLRLEAAADAARHLARRRARASGRQQLSRNQPFSAIFACGIAASTSAVYSRSSGPPRRRACATAPRLAAHRTEAGSARRFYSRVALSAGFHLHIFRRGASVRSACLMISAAARKCGDSWRRGAFAEAIIGACRLANGCVATGGVKAPGIVCNGAQRRMALPAITRAGDIASARF